MLAAKRVYVGMAIFSFLAVFLLGVPAAGAVKVTPGSESALKLDGHISEYSRSEIAVFETPLGLFSPLTKQAFSKCKRCMTR